jgi:protease I
MAPKALLIIAPENFRDEEYFHTKEELEKKGVDVKTASKTTDECRGMLGGIVIPDMALKDVIVDDYDSIAFVGGAGSSVYFDDPAVQLIAEEFIDKGKITAAICIAPSILANAGLLKGKNVTSFASQQENLLEKGAEWTGEPVTIDGQIITANGPKAARAFGQAIARAVNG